MQSYGVRRTHAESENKFNVTAQLKASEAAVAALVSRWEWSHCFWTDGRTHAGRTNLAYFLGKTGTHPHLNEFTLNPFAVLVPTSCVSIPPFVSVDLNVLLKWPGSYSLVYSPAPPWLALTTAVPLCWGQAVCGRASQCGSRQPSWLKPSDVSFQTTLTHITTIFHPQHTINVLQWAIMFIFQRTNCIFIVATKAK